jgi:membrane protease YdiL (CAAX protease family)
MLWSVRVSVKPMPECSPWLLSCSAPSPDFSSQRPTTSRSRAVLAVALIGRLLLLPDIWKASPQACVACALLASVLLHACLDKGRLFTYFGWIQPRRRFWWTYAVTGGLLAALAVIWMIRIAGLSLGTDAPGRLLYGVTVGPIMEEVIFRGAAFSIIYVTASSISALAQWWTALSIAASSALFALAHTTMIGIPMRFCGGDRTQRPPLLSCTQRTTRSLPTQC